MNKKLTILLLTLLLLAGCGSQQRNEFSTWAFATRDTVGGMLGYEVLEKVEVGGFCYWQPQTKVPHTAGMYGMYHWPHTVTIPQPVPLDFLPDTLEGAPYIGGLIGINVDGGRDTVLSGPMAGVVVYEIVDIRYHFQMVDKDLEALMDDEHLLFFGLGPLKF